jgi:stearoyl-CoA desaturase (delta-9 desaturase)
MVIVLFFLIHWYTSLFFQSVFHHRYAAHGLFTMSKFMERLFYIGCFITQGSTYISARAYGILHRLHHANTDTELDPHSPDNSPNLLTMMWQTRNNYYAVYKNRVAVPEKYLKDLPDWKAFDKIAHNWITRILWVAFYISFYVVFATAWWQYLLLPFTLVMGSLQGAIINWWAHRFGYVNFPMENHSKNIIPVDFIFWGEAFHNNHHMHPGRPNNKYKWYEVDLGYQMMVLLHKLGVIKLKLVN